MGNSLVAETEGPQASAGLGLAGDVMNLTSDNDAWDYSVDGVSAGLDALGMVFDPFGAIASAGVGWLLQHVDFLREPIDKLTGDTAAIEALTQTWANIAKALNDDAQSYTSAVRSTEHWTGQAADDYRKAADELVQVLSATANHCEHASEGITAAGIIVGTERAIIYDMLSTFLGRVIVEALVALASSWFSFGSSIAVFVASVDIDASIQAERFSLRIGAVMKRIAKFAQKFTQMGSKAEKLAKDLDKAGNRLRQLAGRSKGLKKGWKTNAPRWSHSPPVSKLINASHNLDHSPLNNVHDVAENKFVKGGTEAGKGADEHHKANEQ
ncbi:MAG: WXG100 family type VII secretion target [Jatrophihabitantaceae bacterium]